MPNQESFVIRTHLVVLLLVLLDVILVVIEGAILVVVIILFVLVVLRRALGIGEVMSGCKKPNKCCIDVHFVFVDTHLDGVSVLVFLFFVVILIVLVLISILWCQKHSRKR